MIDPMAFAWLELPSHTVRAHTIATLMRLGTELAVLSRMVEHVPLAVVRGDGGAASRGGR